MQHEIFQRERFRNISSDNLKEVFSNPNTQLPFQASDMAFFLDKSKNEQQGDYGVNLRTLPYHHRSADLGVNTVINEQLPTADNGLVHNVYCQIDIKGAGLLSPEDYEEKKEGISKGDLVGSGEVQLIPHDVENTWDYEVLGLFDSRHLKHTLEAISKLAKAGMRTETVAAAYEINSLLINGQAMTVEEWKTQTARLLTAEMGGRSEELVRKLRDFKEKFKPVILVRLMRSVIRVRDFKDSKSSQAKVMLDEACENLTNESAALGEEKKFNADSSEALEDWAKFLTYWYGKNLAIMQNLGVVHSFLHMGNLTLAGEIVDLDSVQPVITKIFVGNERKLPSQYSDARTVNFNDDGYAFFIGKEMSSLGQLDERFGLPKCLIKDYRDLAFSVKQLIEYIIKNIPQGKNLPRAVISESLANGFKDNLKEDQPFNNLGLSRSNLVQVFESIVTRCVRDGESMKPVP